MPSVEIEQVSSDFLTVENWRFTFDDSGYRLVLDRYSKAVKPTKRHGFKCVAFYDRLSGRNNITSIDDVPFDDSITNEAYNTFIEKIRVVKAW